jgi:hypothetical protein
MYTKIKHSLIAVLLISTTILFTSCHHDPVDKALDSYENILSKWEKTAKGGQLSSEDMAAEEKELEDVNISGLEKTEKITPKQQTRLAELMKRQAKLNGIDVNN